MLKFSRLSMYLAIGLTLGQADMSGGLVGFLSRYAIELAREVKKTSLRRTVIIVHRPSGHA